MNAAEKKILIWCVEQFQSTCSSDCINLIEHCRLTEKEAETVKIGEGILDHKLGDFLNKLVHGIEIDDLEKDMIIARLKSSFDSYQKSHVTGYLTDGVRELLKDIKRDRVISEILKMFHSQEVSELKKKLKVAHLEIQDLITERDNWKNSIK